MKESEQEGNHLSRFREAVVAVRNTLLVSIPLGCRKGWKPAAPSNLSRENRCLGPCLNKLVQFVLDRFRIHFCAKRLWKIRLEVAQRYVLKR